MVYESDFYTTRRPYSYRPTVTSYSVTRREVPWHLVPTVPRPSQVPPCYTAFGCKGLPDDEDDFLDYIHLRKVQPYHKNIPYVGHKRLVIIHPSSHGWRVKQSSLLGEIDRIYHKVRPSLAYQPKEDYLNSRSMVAFDDETRSIRAKTAEILKRIHTPVPRAQRPLPLPGEAIDEFLKFRHELSNVAMKLIFYPTSLDNDRLYYSHTELPITERIISDNYIDRLLHPIKSVYPVPAVTHYDEPRQYSRLGKGHLACLTFAGGRPISRRKNLASVEGYIRDDINVLSHYNRFRQAAEKAPHVPDTEYGSIPHMPPTKSSVTGSWKSNAPRRTQSDKVSARTTDDDHESQERKRKRREQVEAEAVKEAEEERRRNQELKRQEELAEKAAAERQAELERKAREEEEERILQEEAARMEALKKAQEEEEKRAREEEEARIAKEEEELKAKEAEAKAEAKRKAKEEMERKAEEERKAREEEERRIREEEERKAREEEERKAREEEDRKTREEEERRLKEEEERLLREEEERLTREEERRQKEEEERKAEEERIAREEEEEEEEEKVKTEEEEAEEAAEEEEEKPEQMKAEETVENPQPEEVNESEVEETGDEPVVEEPMSPEVEVAKPAADEDEDEEKDAEEEDE